jgi:hypothetical protein
MDNHSRVGIGATAAFTMAGITAPAISWWAAGPIMLVCSAVAIWGFLPLLRNCWEKWGFGSRGTARSNRLAPMHRVVAHVAGRTSDKNQGQYWPDARRSIRQAALEGRIQVYGCKSEETDNPNATSWSFARTAVPPGYWELADITERATNENCADELGLHTFPHRLSDGRFTKERIAYYTKLFANWDEVKKAWP